MPNQLLSRLAERRQVTAKRYTDPLALLNDREEGIFAGTPYSYKFAPESYAIDAPPEVGEINEKEMSATVLFAKGGNRDRMGDRLNTLGVQDRNHRLNPIWFLNHGKHFYLPIAKTVSPNGDYTVTFDGETGRAKVFYSQHLREAEQVFHLRKEQILRAGSIGYRPIKAYVLPPDPINNLPSGLSLEVTELLEGSDVGLPCNPETVEKITACLSQDRICGKSLHPAIRRSLEPYALPRKPWANGFGYESQIRGKAMPEKDEKEEKETGQEKKKPPPFQKKSGPDTDKPQSPMGAPMVSTTDVKSQEKPQDASPSPKTAPSAGKPKHYGMQLLERLHEDLNMLREDYQEMGEMLEPDSRIRPHIAKFLSDVEKWTASTKEAHGKTYPDADPLSDPNDQGTAADEIEKTMANDTGGQAYDTTQNPNPSTKDYQGNGKAAAPVGVGERDKPHVKTPAGLDQGLNTGPGTAEEGKTGVNHPHMEDIHHAVEFLSKIGEEGLLFNHEHRVLAKHYANALNEHRKSLLGPEAAKQKDSIPTKPQAGEKPDTHSSGQPMELGGKSLDDPQLEAQLDGNISQMDQMIKEMDQALAQAS